MVRRHCVHSDRDLTILSIVKLMSGLSLLYGLSFTVRVIKRVRVVYEKSLYGI